MDRLQLEGQHLLHWWDLRPFGTGSTCAHYSGKSGIEEEGHSTDLHSTSVPDLPQDGLHALLGLAAEREGMGGVVEHIFT